jgi:hypothetical protein
MIKLTAFLSLPNFAQGLGQGLPRALGARGGGYAVQGTANRTRGPDERRLRVDTSEKDQRP